MRALGFDPSKDALRAMIEAHDKDKSGRIDFAEFLDIMIAKIGEKDQGQGLEDAFQLFAQEFKTTDMNGKESVEHYITFQSLKQVATDLQENLTDEELLEMILGGEKPKENKDPFKTHLKSKDFMSILQKSN